MFDLGTRIFNDAWKQEPFIEKFQITGKIKVPKYFFLANQWLLKGINKSKRYTVEFKY